MYCILRPPWSFKSDYRCPLKVMASPLNVTAGHLNVTTGLGHLCLLALGDFNNTFLFAPKGPKQNK